MKICLGNRFVLSIGDTSRLVSVLEDIGSTKVNKEQVKLYNSWYKDLFRMFGLKGGFYDTPDRYIGLGDSDAAKKKYWKSSDPRGSWTLFKVGEPLHPLDILKILNGWKPKFKKDSLIEAFKESYLLDSYWDKTLTHF